MMGALSSSPKMEPPPAAGSHTGDCGFTLIELLVVIAILALLAALIVPASQKALARARTIQGLSNLRQIGQTVLIHTSDNDGAFPFGIYYNAQNAAYSDWALYLSATYLNRHPRFDYTGGATRNEIFRDPGATFPNRGALHFAAHPGLFVENRNGRRSNLSEVHRPSQMIMVMDAGQRPDNGQSLARAVNVPNIDKEPDPSLGGEEIPITTANNADSEYGAGSIRWRVDEGRASKFLFVDGHVAALRKGQLFFENIWNF